MFRSFKIVNVYLDSILFDFEQDEIYHRAFQTNGFFYLFPRSILFIKNKKIITPISIIIYPISFILWPIIINPILVLFSFLKWIPKMLKTDNYELKTKTNLYLNLSDSKYFSFINTSDVFYPSHVITFPFHSSNRDNLNKFDVLCFFRLTTFKNMLLALLFSFITPFFSILSKKKYLLLYTYSSFYWYWVFFSLNNKNINSIWVSNHYDRWVALLDNLNRVKNKILVQHGQLEYIHTDHNLFFPEFTNKLTQINKVYTINDKSSLFYSKFIINNSLELGQIKLKLNLYKIKNSNCVNVLIIGHQQFNDFHNHLIELLNINSRVSVFFKPHPQQLSIPLVEGISVVQNNLDIPEVDVVISYGSSIDFEINHFLPRVKFLYVGLIDVFNVKAAVDRINQELVDIIFKFDSC
jgi:hypothetical protein